MKVTAESYVEMFKMDQPRFNFDRKAFIERFGNDFLSTLHDLSKTGSTVNGFPKYKVFKAEVKIAQELFNRISEILEDAGKKPLSKGLWNVFFASYVIETRKLFYKDIQEKIDFKKKIAAEQWKDLKPLADKLHSDENKTKNKPSKKGKGKPYPRT